MEKISVKERLPNSNSVVLVYGHHCGDISGKSSVKHWYHVQVYPSGGYYGIGGDYYSWWVEDVDYWADLSELYK